MKVKSLLTKKDVNSFMRLSGDYNPIHWDESFLQDLYMENLLFMVL